MSSVDNAPKAPGGTAVLAGRTVARIGLGAMQLADPPGGRRGPSREQAVAVLRTAVARGVNHIDTAQFYGAGACNEVIRAALHPYPDDLSLVSKVGADHDPAAGTLVPAQRPEQLRASVEENLTALGTDHLAVVNLRRLDVAPGLVAEGDQRVDLDSQLAELIALRDAGTIGGIGLSNVDTAQLRQALPAGIVCVQNAHSPLDRAAEPVLDVCREHGVAWVPFIPLGSAFPAIPKVAEHPVVVEAAAALGATPAQVGLAWHLAHYARTLLIPGTADPAHLADNLAAGAVRLDPATLAAIDALAPAA